MNLLREPGLHDMIARFYAAMKPGRRPVFLAGSDAGAGQSDRLVAEQLITGRSLITPFWLIGAIRAAAAAMSAMDAALRRCTRENPVKSTRLLQYMVAVGTGLIFGGAAQAED
jgi:hypothetical protein